MVNDLTENKPVLLFRKQLKTRLFGKC